MLQVNPSTYIKENLPNIKEKFKIIGEGKEKLKNAWGVALHICNWMVVNNFAKE